MAKAPFSFKDVQNTDLLNAPFVSILELTDKPIIIHSSELIQDKRIVGKEKFSVRFIVSTPDNDEKVTTLTGSEYLIQFHHLISEQELYPIQVTIKAIGKRYVIE